MSEGGAKTTKRSAIGAAFDTAVRDELFRQAEIQDEAKVRIARALADNKCAESGLREWFAMRDDAIHAVLAMTWLDSVGADSEVAAYDLLLSAIDRWPRSADAVLRVRVYIKSIVGGPKVPEGENMAAGDSPRLDAGLVEAARIDLAKLDGAPPYDSPTNVVRGDGYFASSLAKKYGMSISDLRRAVGVPG